MANPRIPYHFSNDGPALNAAPDAAIMVRARSDEDADGNRAPGPAALAAAAVAVGASACIVAGAFEGTPLGLAAVRRREARRSWWVMRRARPRAPGTGHVFFV